MNGELTDRLLLLAGGGVMRMLNRSVAGFFRRDKRSLVADSQ